MVFRLKLLMLTIKYFSVEKPFFSVVVNQHNTSLPLQKELILNRGHICDAYISKNADIYHCDYHWAIPVPARWFIVPKDETCVLIDADMVACQDLSCLNYLDKDKIHGVTTNKQHLTDAEWISLGFSKSDLKYYLNFGLIIVPSSKLLEIGEQMLNNVFYIIDRFPHQQYYSGQIALAYTLKQLMMPINVLPKQFNWYDLLPPDNLNDIIFLHYFRSRQYIVSENTACCCNRNEYTKLIGKLAQKFYKIF